MSSSVEPAQWEDQFRSQLLARRRAPQAPGELIASCLGDVSEFLDGSPLSDDLTVLALARGGGVA